jgi:7-carboxy-7-deazaguanine synthase
MSDAATAESRNLRGYPVNEIFHSIQGEGTQVGRPSTFIRLTGCNYTCHWCDTPHTWKMGQIRKPEWQTAEHLLGQIKFRSVVITGGEPLLHDLQPLLTGLGDRHVTIETNGSIAADHEEVSLWSLSPKLASSGHHPDTAVIGHYLSRFPGRVQLKFVIGSEADLAEVKTTLAKVPDARKAAVILQPVTPQDEAFDRETYLDRYAGWVLSVPEDPFWQHYNLQLLPQLHRLCWPHRDGI